MSYMTYRIAPGWVYFAGEAENRGSAAAGYVGIAISLLDEQGRVAATSSANEVHVEYVPFEFLSPGQNAPFQIMFQNLQTAPDRFEMLAEGHLPNRGALGSWLVGAAGYISSDRRPTTRCGWLCPIDPRSGQSNRSAPLSSRLTSDR